VNGWVKDQISTAGRNDLAQESDSGVGIPAVAQLMAFKGHCSKKRI